MQKKKKICETKAQKQWYEDYTGAPLSDLIIICRYIWDSADNY